MRVFYIPNYKNSKLKVIIHESSKKTSWKDWFYFKIITAQFVRIVFFNAVVDFINFNPIGGSSRRG